MRHYSNYLLSAATHWCWCPAPSWPGSSWWRRWAGPRPPRGRCSRQGPRTRSTPSGRAAPGWWPRPSPPAAATAAAWSVTRTVARQTAGKDPQCWQRVNCSGLVDGDDGESPSLSQSLQSHYSHTIVTLCLAPGTWQDYCGWWHWSRTGDTCQCAQPAGQWPPWQRYSGTRHAPREEMTSRYVTTMSHVLVTSYCCSQLLWLLWQGLAAATKESSAALL